MAGFLTCHHYTGRVLAQVLADRLAANLLTASGGAVAGKSLPRRASPGCCSCLNSQLADHDDAIAAALAEHPDTPIFASFPASARC